MSTVSHTELSRLMQKSATSWKGSVWLVHGEELLVEKACRGICGHLLGEASRSVSCETMEGIAENIHDLLAQMNTYAMLADIKVMVFKDARIFETRSNQEEKLVRQIADAYENDQLLKAARAFLHLCGRLGIDLNTRMDAGIHTTALKNLRSELGDEAVARLAACCNDQGWKSAAPDDHMSALLMAIEKGFPDHHHLVITSYAKVSKGLKLYKKIQSQGVVVDCTVPSGRRKADKTAQESVLRQNLEEHLNRAGKKLAPGAFDRIVRLTGFDLPTFAQNLDKLIDYVGDRAEITPVDVDAIVQRTKTDPVYEFTNAVAGRNVQQALFYLSTLLKADWHPLQLITALANQFRKLLVAKDFATGEHGRSWSTGISYHQFQKDVMPAIERYDQRIGEHIEAWAGNEKSKGGTADLRLAPNPKNAYPVYQTLAKSENYSITELVQVMVALGEADAALKSTGQDAAMVVKSAVIRICRASNQSNAD